MKRYIERSKSDYSAWGMVEELREQARLNWRNMHFWRKNTPEVPCQYAARFELEYRERLRDVLKVLNAGLDREGSYERTYWRVFNRNYEAQKGVAA